MQSDQQIIYQQSNSFQLQISAEQPKAENFPERPYETRGMFLNEERQIVHRILNTVGTTVELLDLLKEEEDVYTN